MRTWEGENEMKGQGEEREVGGWREEGVKRRVDDGLRGGDVVVLRLVV